MKPNQHKWVVWSGEGTRGTKEIKVATENGIKRILTAERCHGDRWAFAAKYTGDDYMDCCPVAKERSIDY